jgi:hypothetical protein
LVLTARAILLLAQLQISFEAAVQALSRRKPLRTTSHIF